MSKKSQKPANLRRDQAEGLQQVTSRQLDEQERRQQQELAQQPAAAKLKRSLDHGTIDEFRLTNKRQSSDNHLATSNQRSQQPEVVGVRPPPPVDTTGGEANICAACQRPIRERYLLVALDKRWHEDCLKCACCDCRLGEVGSSLFTHSNKLLCRRDFLRIFGQQGHCAACRRPIPPYELVMRAQDKAYHLDCFACQRCQYRFCVGDRFHLTDRHKIICLLCYNEQQRQQAAAAASQLEERLEEVPSSELPEGENFETPEVGQDGQNSNLILTQLKSVERKSNEATINDEPSSPQATTGNSSSLSCPPTRQIHLAGQQQQQQPDPGERACVM